VYGHEFATLKTFQTMKSHGGFCIFDQFIAHHRVIAREVDTEYAQFPQTETPYDRHLRRMVEVRNARKDAELALADLIITASTFTCNSLIEVGFPAERIRVVPMGGPPVLTDIPVKPKKPLVFLSAGSQSVRKGTHYLLEAWRKLRPDRHAELWMIGRMALPEELLQNLPGTVVIRPTVPRQELYSIYQQASVLVFPSLCEGFGMVITEAMAHGVPVISTTHTAAPDLMTSGNEGLIVPVRDIDALAEAMQWCIDHPAEVIEMGRRAHARVSQQQWSDYRIRLRKVVTEFLHTCE
jgi:glycosyltransferase involved in cell wall biosynthesis